MIIKTITATVVLIVKKNSTAFRLNSCMVVFHSHIVGQVN